MNNNNNNKIQYISECTAPQMFSLFIVQPVYRFLTCLVCNVTGQPDDGPVAKSSNGTYPCIPW